MLALNKIWGTLYEGKATKMGRMVSLAAPALVALAMLGSLACIPFSLSDEFEAATLDSEGKPLAPLEVLDALGADNTPLESLRITETQRRYVTHPILGRTRETTTRIEEFQRPDRWRLDPTSVIPESDEDGGGDGCVTTEVLKINSSRYERCGDEPWTVTQRSAYVVPDISPDDLLDKVQELENLRRLENQWLYNRPRLTFRGDMPNKPQGVTVFERTVWIDIETTLVLRIEEEIEFEGLPWEEPWTDRVTIVYTDHNQVVIEEPETG